MLEATTKYAMSGKVAKGLLILCIIVALAAGASGADALRSGAAKVEGQALTWTFSIDGVPTATRSTGGDQLVLEGFASGGAPGEPALPTRRITLLLPEDVVRKSVKATLVDPVWEDLAGTFDISPAPPAATMIDGKTVFHWGSRDKAPASNGRYADVYGADRYSDGGIGRVSLRKYRQWNTVVVEIRPVSVNPVQKTARVLRSATVRVDYKQDETLKTKMRPAISDHFWKNLEPRLLNPEHRSGFYDYSTRTGKDWEDATRYWVIVPESLYTTAPWGIDDFLRYKMTAGHLNVGIVTVSGGSSAQARALFVRQWLENNYLVEGIESVLLIGNPSPATFESASSLPMLYCNAGSVYADIYWTPTDMAFAELSSDWDKDEDGVYGEWPSDEIDQDCEIAVGRVPYYGNTAELYKIMHKLIDHQTGLGNQDWRKNVIFPAAISNHSPQDENNDGDADDSGELFFPYQRVFGDTWADEMDDLAGDAGHTAWTLLEKTGVYDDGTAYPLDDCSAPLTLTNLLGIWQTNRAGFVAWWGHGSVDGAYRRVWATELIHDHITQYPEEVSMPAFWTSANCPSLDDYRPAIVVQVSCTNGYPEQNTNLGYQLLLNGAAATVSSSRVSWYAVMTWTTDIGETYGDNASVGYLVYKGMGPRKKSVGMALNDTRSDFGFYFEEAAWMNLLDFNIYGDPEAKIEPYPHAITGVQKRAIESTDAFAAYCWNFYRNATTNYTTGTGDGELEFDCAREKWLALVVDDLTTTETAMDEVEWLWMP